MSYVYNIICYCSIIIKQDYLSLFLYNENLLCKIDWHQIHLKESILQEVTLAINLFQGNIVDS